MADPFPTYDVLAKRDTLSWNDQTRAVIDRRLAMTVREDVLSETQMATLRLVTARICPDPAGRPATTTLAMIVDRIAKNADDGYTHYKLPGTADAWKRGLDAIDAEAQARFATPFAALDAAQADDVLRAVQCAETRAPHWDDLPPKLFWSWRMVPDLVSAHWAQPSLWSAMGFGGPASPRGYVRTAENRRDPWEAVEESDAPVEGLPRHHEP